MVGSVEIGVVVRSYAWVRNFLFGVGKAALSLGDGEGVLLFDAGGESGFDDVDQLRRGDAGVD